VPELKRRFVCVGSAIVATPPIPGRLTEIGWTGGESITDSQATVDYYRTTRDGRIVFGKGGGRLYFTGEPGATAFNDPVGIAEAAADFRRTYPMLADVAGAATASTRAESAAGFSRAWRSTNATAGRRTAWSIAPPGASRPSPCVF
jgi:hypothetical protein